MLAAMRTKALPFTLALAAGCAAGASTEAAGKPTSAPPASAPPALSASRDLPRGATYGELVAALDLEDSLTPSAARCLLARTSDGLRFEGTPSVALHPLPDTAADLDRLVHGTSARVLTRHGSYGSAQASLGVVALSDGPPTRGALLLALTDRALYLRTLEAADARVVDDLAKLPALVAEVARDASVYVAAESAVPVARVYEVLRALAPQSAPVVLAMVLPDEVTLPAPPQSAEAPRRCPDGLGETDALQGDLPVAALQEGVAPLRERAADCLRRAEGPGAAGGRMTLALRVDGEGRVSDACVVASEANDAALESCVVTLARDLRFQPPSPPGVVDAELPLSLKPASGAAQKPVCE
jgi:TonB family protein